MNNKLTIEQTLRNIVRIYLLSVVMPVFLYSNVTNYSEFFNTMHFLSVGLVWSSCSTAILNTIFVYLLFRLNIFDKFFISLFYCIVEIVLYYVILKNMENCLSTYITKSIFINMTIPFFMIFAITELYIIIRDLMLCRFRKKIFFFSNINISTQQIPYYGLLFLITCIVQIIYLLCGIDMPVPKSELLYLLLIAYSVHIVITSSCNVLVMIFFNKKWPIYRNSIMLIEAMLFVAILQPLSNVSYAVGLLLANAGTAIFVFSIYNLLNGKPKISSIIRRMYK